MLQNITKVNLQVGREVDKFENFAKILKAVDEATSDEDIIDYFREDSFLL